MPDVFLSYSRRDGEFVRALVADLEARGKSVWLDTEGIEDGAVFPAAIRSAIEGSDSFVFVISPESAASQYCGQEVDHAVALNKRLVPVLRELVADEALPEAVRVRNWIPFTDGVDIDAACDRLVSALDTDLEHAHAHTRWLVKAVEWENHKGDKSFLLRGSELSVAEGWLAGAGKQTEPIPTTLQREYVLAGRTASVRRQRIVVGASLAAVVVAVALAVAALVSRGQAISAKANAQSRVLAAASATQLSVDPERALLLAMEAERTRQTPEATYALRRAIDLSPLDKRLPSVGDQSRGNGFGPNVAFSPDGAQIAEGSWNGTIQLVDARTMEVRRRINAGTNAPWVAWSPTGSVLAVGADSGVILLDPGTGRRLGTIAAMSNSQGLQFSPDGTRLAAIAASADGSGGKLVVWDRRTQRSRVFPLQTVGSAQGTNFAFSVGFSPDGHRVVVGAINGFGVFDVRTGRLIASHTGDQVTHAEYSSDGSLIAVTRKSAPSASIKTFRADLLDARTFERRATIYSSRDPAEVVRWTTFSPDGTRVAFVAGDVFGIFSLRAHRMLYQTTVSAPYLAGAGFSRDGRQFAVMAGDGSGAVYRASGAEQEVIDAGRINETMIGSPIALGRDRVVAAYSPTSGSRAGREIAQAWRWDGTPIGGPLVLSGDNCPVFGVEAQARFAYTGHGRRDCQAARSRVVRIWDIPLRRPVGAMNPSNSAAFDAAFNRDGSRIAEQLESGPGGSIDLLNTRSGKTTFVGSSACGFSAQAVSDDGTLVAALDRCPSRLLTWSVTAAGATVPRLKLSIGNSGGPVRFSPSGTRLAIANTRGRGNIAIVATGTGKTVATLVGHSNRIVDLAYSPDGKLIVTGSLDGTARVWDPESGRLLRTLDHPVPVFGVAFSPDGRTIATLDADGIVRLWDACTDCENPDALMALAKTRVTRQLTAIEKRTYLG